MRTRKTGLLCAVVAAAAFAAPMARASEPEVVALFKDRAVLRTAAGERMLRVGETSSDGVELLAANGHAAKIRYQGREQTLVLAQRAAGGFATPKQASVAISPDDHGQYRVGGSINGRPAQFIVDTGASVVVMSGAHARALGLAYQHGGTGSIQTAQGTIPAFLLDVDSVAVAGIEGQGVRAAVIEGDFPADILLGMSFLREVGIEAKDGVLTLSRKH
jgi:aspartyl protease family protein